MAKDLVVWRILSLFLVLLVSYSAEYSRKTTSFSQKQFTRLTLWIEGRETKEFVGYPMDIFVIRDGTVEDYLRESYLDNRFPVLPSKVFSVHISWIGPDDKYFYRFSELKSLDPQLLYDPVLSIPREGLVPNVSQAFELAIPCKKRETGIASMYMCLEITNSSRYQIPGSPLKIHIRKSCINAVHPAPCTRECLNGGRCNDGVCDCRAGFYGVNCRYAAACLPQCENNGTCVRPGECACQRGYYGSRCESVVCDVKCLNGGFCSTPNVCDCPTSHYGHRCQYRAGRCPVTCQNNGFCSNQNVCICPRGWAGAFCQTAVCKRSCGEHGRCVAPNTCECERGWRGKKCHKLVIRPDKYYSSSEELYETGGLTKRDKPVKSRFWRRCCRSNRHSRRRECRKTRKMCDVVWNGRGARGNDDELELESELSEKERRRREGRESEGRKQEEKRRRDWRERGGTRTLDRVI